MFTNLLQSLEPARKYLCGHHLQPALAGVLASIQEKPNLKGTRVSATESKNKSLKQEKLDAWLEAW